jgi:hypothetical protein
MDLVKFYKATALDSASLRSFQRLDVSWVSMGRAGAFDTRRSSSALLKSFRFRGIGQYLSGASLIFRLLIKPIWLQASLCVCQDGCSESKRVLGRNNGGGGGGWRWLWIESFIKPPGEHRKKQERGSRLLNDADVVQ